MISLFWKKSPFYSLFKNKFIEGGDKIGWQNYLPIIKPKTNNKIEDYSNYIKQTVTDLKSNSFEEYLQLVKNKLIFFFGEEGNPSTLLLGYKIWKY